MASPEPDYYTLLSQNPDLVAVAHWDIPNTAPAHDTAAFDAFAAQTEDDFYAMMDESLARIHTDGAAAT